MVPPRGEIRASRGCPSLWTLDPVGRASLGGACGGGDGELSRECGCAGLKVAMRAVVPPRVWPQRAAEASPRSRCGGGSGPLCRLWVDSTPTHSVESHRQSCASNKQAAGKDGQLRACRAGPARDRGVPEQGGPEGALTLNNFSEGIGRVPPARVRVRPVRSLLCALRLTHRLPSGRCLR